MVALRPFHGTCSLCSEHPVAGRTADGHYLCSRCLVVDFLHDQANQMDALREEPTDDDGIDHACGECGGGIPSYQADGSLCSFCADDIRREQATEAGR